MITALVGVNGWIDSLDVLLAARGTAGSTQLVPRPDLATHQRARFGTKIRDNLETFGYPDPERSAVVTLSRGIAGLLELSFEIEPDYRGDGTNLVHDALRVLPEGQLAVAAVAPGNAASLRAAMRAGFTVLGSIQLFSRD